MILQENSFNCDSALDIMICHVHRKKLNVRGYESCSGLVIFQGSYELGTFGENNVTMHELFFIPSTHS